MTSGIYKYTNKINNHLYIGKSLDIEKRKINHLSCANNPKSKEYNYPLHRAIRKYGIENFDFEIIEEITHENLLLEREKYWIKYYDSYHNSCHYNITSGGEGVSGYTHKLETKQQISDTLKDFYKTERGKRIKEQARQRLLDNPLPYKSHSLEWKQNQSKRMQGKNNPQYQRHSNGKRVLCIETNQIFPSVRSAAKQVGRSHTSISQACRNLRKTSAGYHWKYV